MSEQYFEKIVSRLHNLNRRVTLKVGDDSGNYQLHQTEGFKDELRSDVPRYQEFGFSSVPLPGAQGLTAATHAGYPGSAAITNTNDIRYRYRGEDNKGQKPGENSMYMVDEADKKTGDNGKVRPLIKGALGWLTTVFGKTVNIGDKNVTTLNVGTSPDNDCTITVGKNNVTINVRGKNIDLQVDHGDIKVDGVSLVHHTHPDPQGGNTGEPNHS